MNTRLELYNDDCLNVLRTLPSDSVEALVTDPPAGISFMGKDWDGDKGGRDAWVAWMTEIMRECRRVMKPGSHGLVWALPRTSHWTATALENAGFDVRDIVTHIFGSGFPKSHDISKAIDKAEGAKREIVRPGFTSSQEQGETYARGLNANFQPRQLSAPSSELAKKWQGWGTALKPASEHWILIRKPLSEKTVARNVLEHSTGGLNLDACRIEAPDHPGVHHAGSSGSGSLNWNSSEVKISSSEYYLPNGRFPANLVLSHNSDCGNVCSPDCPIAILDRQSGITKSTAHSRGNGIGSGYHGSNGDYVNVRGAADSGGASRFFYVAKASKSNKGIDNTHPTVKSTILMSYLIKLVTPIDGIILDPFMGSGSTGIAAINLGFGFIGIEQSQEYFQISEERIAKILYKNFETSEVG